MERQEMKESLAFLLLRGFFRKRKTLLQAEGAKAWRREAAERRAYV